MKNRTQFAALAALVGTMTVAGSAGASSHREAPLMTEDPAADSTDLYAFVQGTA
jgi:hypothetical protein